jgi:hypothetical protein
MCLQWELSAVVRSRDKSHHSPSFVYEFLQWYGAKHLILRWLYPLITVNSLTVRSSTEAFSQLAGVIVEVCAVYRKGGLGFRYRMFAMSRAHLIAAPPRPTKVRGSSTYTPHASA